MADPYRSRTRAAAVGGNSVEIQLRIDPMHVDFDEEVTGLRKQVRQLRNQMTLINAQAGVKNNMRVLNKSIIRE